MIVGLSKSLYFHIKNKQKTQLQGNTSYQQKPLNGTFSSKPNPLTHSISCETILLGNPADCLIVSVLNHQMTGFKYIPQE